MRQGEGVHQWLGVCVVSPNVSSSSFSAVFSFQSVALVFVFHFYKSSKELFTFIIGVMVKGRFLPIPSLAF